MELKLNKPSAILFDWDNTLVDTWPLIHGAMHVTMEKWGIEPWTMQEVKDRVGKSMRDSFPEIFGDAWQQAGDFYLSTYRNFPANELVFLPDAIELLEFLQQYHAPIGLVSNKMGESLRREVEAKGIAHYFKAIIGAGDAERDKPYADPAALALQKIGVSMNDNVWFVGDTITDLGCAKAGGMSGILYGDVQPDGEKLYRGHDFIHHSRNHRELLALLKEYH